MKIQKIFEETTTSVGFYISLFFLSSKRQIQTLSNLAPPGTVGEHRMGCFQSLLFCSGSFFCIFLEKLCKKTGTSEMPKFKTTIYQTWPPTARPLIDVVICLSTLSTFYLFISNPIELGWTIWTSSPTEFRPQSKRAIPTPNFHGSKGLFSHTHGSVGMRTSKNSFLIAFWESFSRLWDIKLNFISLQSSLGSHVKKHQL